MKVCVTYLTDRYINGKYYVKFVSNFHVLMGSNIAGIGCIKCEVCLFYVCMIKCNKNDAPNSEFCSHC